MNRPIFHLKWWPELQIRLPSQLVYSMIEEQIWIELFNLIGSCYELTTGTHTPKQMWNG